MGLVAQDRISHVIIVGNLHFIEEDHVLKLRGIPHHNSLSHNGVAPDEGALAHLRVLADNGRPVDISGLKHGGGLGDPHILPHLVILFRRKGLSQLLDKGADLRKHLPGIGHPLKNVPGNGLL